MDLLKLRPKLQCFPVILNPSPIPSHKTQLYPQRFSIQSAVKRFRVLSELNGKLNGALSGDTDPRFIDRVCFFFFLLSLCFNYVFHICLDYWVALGKL